MAIKGRVKLQDKGNPKRVMRINAIGLDSLQTVDPQVFLEVDVIRTTVFKDCETETCVKSPLVSQTMLKK